MDVFVSYSGKDIEFTKKMCAVLKDNGISYWAAHEHNCLGNDSADKTVNYISKAKIVLVFVSKNSNESKHVINELNCATMYKKPILPVVIDDVELSPVFEYYMANANRLSYSQSGDFVEKFIDIVRSMTDIDNTLPADKKEEQKAVKQNSLNDKSKKNKIVIIAVAVLVAVAAVVAGVWLMRPKGNETSASIDGTVNGESNAFSDEATENESGALYEEVIENEYYASALNALASGNKAQAAILFGKAANEGYGDARERSFALWREMAQYTTVSAGYDHTVGLKLNGRVVAVGNDGYNQCNISGWTDIVEVSARLSHTIGLKSNGTVMAVGWNEYGLCNVSDWNDIIAVSAGECHTVGLKSDGTVVAVGYNKDGRCNVSDWSDIVAIAAGVWNTIGIKSDGTVVATTVGYDEYDYGQCNVSGWTDIVAVSAGTEHTVGIRVDGTVVAAGLNSNGQCNISNWANIVAVSAGSGHTVGLKSDGTVVAVGDNDFGECDVSGWTDIVAVSAGYKHTVGLKADGTVVAVGSNSDGKCDVSGWTDIKQP